MNQYVPATRVAEILSTAEEVMETCGHTRELFMDRQGSVCLGGAIGVAIVDPTLQLDIADRMSAFSAQTLSTEYLATIQTLALVLPTVCCGHEHRGSTGVFHFNDLHCDGGELARTVLREAREKLEAEL